MSAAIIPQLVRKDFLMMRKIILICCLLNLASIVVISLLFGHVPNWVFFNLGFTLLIAPTGACGIVLILFTIVAEKQKSTQLFIMSLPVTVKEFTLAKLLVNLPVFTVFWLVITGVAFYFSFLRGMFPYGTVPFITMIFLGIFLVYIGTLSASLITQSHGITILTMLFFEMGTPTYLWVIAFLEPIDSHKYDQNMVWNSTAISIVATQTLVAVAMLLVTLYIQSKKRDFI